MTQRAAMCSLDYVKILIIADRCWGKGNTIKEALEKARWTRSNGKQCWQAFICHKDTYVDELGRVIYPIGFVPREISRMGIGKKDIPFITFTRGDYDEK